jgi:hypothetical protein
MEVLTLHFRNPETFRELQRAAATLGISPDELAEAAIESELASMGARLDDKLARMVERLRTSGPGDLDRAIEDFARAEVEVDDPLKAHRVESADAYGIGALFGDRLEHG